jgi:hypothetical protein
MVVVVVMKCVRSGDAFRLRCYRFVEMEPNRFSLSLKR